ncbi:unnamed protein product [Sphagnum compactum]
MQMTSRRVQRNQVSSLLPKHAKICTWMLFTNMGFITMPRGVGRGGCNLGLQPRMMKDGGYQVINLHLIS